ncbi:MAG: tetratricopeptide repeat protein [Pseudomonadota bacterium]
MTRTPIIRTFIACGLMLAAAPVDAQILSGGAASRARSLVEQGDDRAARQVLERADRLSPEGAYLLGMLCEEGRGGPRDLSAAVRAYSVAAQAGYADAQYALGRLILVGETGAPDAAPDPAGAADWFALAVEQGQAEAMVALARLHAEGRGVAIDEVYAADLFERAARLGNAEAAYELARAFQLGRGRAQSFDRARGWYEEAVAAGHPEASYRFGLLLRAGLGGPQDPSRAEQLIRYAAGEGVPPAMTAVGVMELKSPGGDPEVRAARAADWFERAAEAGDDEGTFLLAVVYAQGRGRPMDRDKALELVEASLAAAPGDLNPRERAARVALRDALLAPPVSADEVLAEEGDETAAEAPSPEDVDGL